MSARGLALWNARVSSIVFTLQLFFPRRFYDSYLSKLVSDWTGWNHVILEPSNSPAHAITIAFQCATLAPIWMAATSPRKEAHACLALMELLFASASLISLTPLFPPDFKSSITLIGALPNLAFGLGICWAGGIGLADFLGLFGRAQGGRDVTASSQWKNGRASGRL